METDFLSVISIKVFTQCKRNEFCFNKIDKKCSVSKLEKTFVLIDIEKNWKKNMVEEIFKQDMYIFFSQNKEKS